MVLAYKIKKDRVQRLKQILPIDYDYKPKKSKNFVYFAVDKRREYAKKIAEEDIEVLDVKLERVKERPRSVRELLRKQGIKGLSSFEIIGDIAVFEPPKRLEDRPGLLKSVADSIMRIHPRVKTVLCKEGGMKGAWRIRKLRLIKGENKTTTLYTENGCRFKLDLSKMYYSTRLATERKRIAELINDKKENVLVPFAGYGPFAITIAKFNPSCKVVGIEINPNAVRFFRENIRLNRLKNIEVLEGDAREIIKKEFVKWADRIVMPLPKNTLEYLSEIIIGAKDICILHIYTFSDARRIFEDVEEELNKRISKEYSYEILYKRVVRPYSPDISQVVFDIKTERRQNK